MVIPRPNMFDAQLEEIGEGTDAMLRRCGPRRAGNLQHLVACFEHFVAERLGVLIVHRHKVEVLRWQMGKQGSPYSQPRGPWTRVRKLDMEIVCFILRQLWCRRLDRLPVKLDDQAILGEFAKSLE